MLTQGREFAPKVPGARHEEAAERAVGRERDEVEAQRLQQRGLRAQHGGLLLAHARAELLRADVRLLHLRPRPTLSLLLGTPT